MNHTAALIANPLALRLLFAFVLFLAACKAPAPTRTPAPTAVLPDKTTAASGSATTRRPLHRPPPRPPPPPTDTAVPHFIVGYAADADGAPKVLQELQAMATPLGWDVVSPPGGATAIGALAQLGAQVVVANGATLEADTRQAATAFPQTYFIGVNQSGTGDDLPNLLVLGAGPSREDQLGFMAGVVAGYATQAQVVTGVGYQGSTDGFKYRNGFLHGVRYSCTRCRVDLVDAVSLNSDPTAVERARLNASLSSDVVFAAPAPPASRRCGPQPRRTSGSSASDSDVYQTKFGGSGAEADHVLASVYFDPAAAVTAALAAYQSGSPWAGSRPYSATDGAVALAPFRVTEDVLSELDRSDIAAALAKLASGELETGIDPLTGNER